MIAIQVPGAGDRGGGEAFLYIVHIHARRLIDLSLIAGGSAKARLDVVAVGRSTRSQKRRPIDWCCGGVAACARDF